MKKKVLYVERGIDEYGLYEGTQDAMKDLNVELSITLDPKDIEDCDGVIFPGGLPDVDLSFMGKRIRAARTSTERWMMSRWQ